MTKLFFAGKAVLPSPSDHKGYWVLASGYIRSRASGANALTAGRRMPADAHGAAAAREQEGNDMARRRYADPAGRYSVWWEGRIDGERPKLSAAACVLNDVHSTLGIVG